MTWGMLSLVPLALAVLALARLRLKRRWFAAIPLAAASGVLVLVPFLGTSERVIVIVDSTSNDALKAARTALAGEAGRSLDIVNCRGVAIRSASDPKLDSGKTDWSHTCLGAAFEQAADPASALQRAATLLDQRTFGTRIGDLVTQRGLRVVVVVTAPKRWRENTWTIDVAAEVGKLRARGATVDLLDMGRGGGGSSATLTISPRQTFIPVSGDTRERFQFDLKLTGLETTARRATAECTLGGDCFDGNDCGTDETCSEHQCRKRCNSGCDAAETCVQGVCMATHADRHAWYLAETAIDLVSDERGLTSAKPLSIGDFQTTAPRREVPRGWHPLRCRMKIASAVGQVESEATQFFNAREGYLFAVWGKGTQFRLDGKAITNKQANELAGAELVGHGAQVGDALTLGASLMEERLAADMSQPPNCGPGASVDLRCHEPSVLVVNDASPTFWKTHCPWVVKEVATRGMSLIASGVPPDLDECKDLPVYAIAPDPKGPQQLFDRRPVVTFVFDGSRVGRLKWGPTSAPVEAKKLHELADGLLDVQAKIVERTLEQYKWKFERETGHMSSTVGSAPRFVNFRAANDYSAMVVKQADDVDTMMKDSSAARRVGDLVKLASKAGSEGTVRFGVEDIYVVFSYDIKQGSFGTGAPFRELLSQGATIIVVPIKTPFSAAFESGTDLVTSIKDGRVAGHGPLKARVERIVVADPISLEQLDTSAGVKATTELVTRVIEEHRSGGHMRVGVHWLGRFVDERLVPSGKVESTEAPAIPEWGAPLRVQRLAVRKQMAPLLSLVASKQSPASLEPIAAGYGAMLGRGHVLMLGYSLFEGELDDWIYGEVPWSKDPKARLAIAGSPNAWGSSRIVDLARFTSDLEDVPTSTPKLARLRVVGGRFLELDVTERMEKASSLDRLYLIPHHDQTPADHCADEPGATRLPITSLRPETHSLVLGLSPTQRRQLCDGKPCAVRLCRESCTGSHCGPERDNEQIYLPSTRRADLQETAALSAIDQVRTLAFFTSGGEGNIASSVVATRSPSVFVIGTGLLLLWLGAASRLIRRRLEQRARQGHVVDQGQTTGIVNQIGESLGQPSPDVPAGAFAGYRPFDPGDKLRSAVLTDVVIMAGVLEPDELAVAPRIIQKVDERSRRVRLIVNAGPSMRIPSRPDLPKLRAASRVAELLAEIAWSGRGEVVVETVGCSVKREVGPLVGGAGDAAITSFLHDPRLAPLASWRAPLRIGEVEDGESIIYISDLLNEDLDELAKQAAMAELDGCACGFVHVYAPEELALTDMAVHVGSGTLTDRSDWTVTELVAQHRRFVEKLEGSLGDCAGGLIEVSGAFSAADIVELVRSSPLHGLLR